MLTITMLRSINKCGRLRLGGSVTVEFLFSFPLLLALFLACMQISHIWVARHVVQYAAFSAARATLTAQRGEYRAVAQQAAEQVCAWIVKGHRAGEEDKEIPGWGLIPGSGAVGRKTRVRVSERDWNVEVEVEHDFALIIPIAGPIIGWAVNPWRSGGEWLEQRADPTGNAGAGDLIRSPHVRFRERALLSKPYVTLSPAGLPSGGW
jgi:hypothetical protein